MSKIEESERTVAEEVRAAFNQYEAERNIFYRIVGVALYKIHDIRREFLVLWVEKKNWARVTGPQREPIKGVQPQSRLRRSVQWLFLPRRKVYIGQFEHGENERFLAAIGRARTQQLPAEFSTFKEFRQIILRETQRDVDKRIWAGSTELIEAARLMSNGNIDLDELRNPFYFAFPGELRGLLNKFEKE